MSSRPNTDPVRYRPSRRSGSGHRGAATDSAIGARSSGSAGELRGAVTAAPIEVGTPTLCPVSQLLKHRATESERPRRAHAPRGGRRITPGQCGKDTNRTKRAWSAASVVRPYGGSEKPSDDDVVGH